jgi:hypothetical protein
MPWARHSSGIGIDEAYVTGPGRASAYRTTCHAAGRRKVTLATDSSVRSAGAEGLGAGDVGEGTALGETLGRVVAEDGAGDGIAGAHPADKTANTSAIVVQRRMPTFKTRFSRYATTASTGARL